MRGGISWWDVVVECSGEMWLWQVGGGDGMLEVVVRYRVVSLLLSYFCVSCNATFRILYFT